MAVDYYNGVRAYRLGADFALAFNQNYLWLCNNADPNDYEIHADPKDRYASVLYVTFNDPTVETMFLLSCGAQ
jgi:hypothetical protein